MRSFCVGLLLVVLSMAMLQDLGLRIPGQVLEVARIVAAVGITAYLVALALLMMCRSCAMAPFGRPKQSPALVSVAVFKPPFRRASTWWRMPLCGVSQGRQGPPGASAKASPRVPLGAMEPAGSYQDKRMHRAPFAPDARHLSAVERRAFAETEGT